VTARVLIYDIEVSPIVAYTWDLKPFRLPIENIVEDPRILCIGFKWLGEKKVHLISEWEHGREGMLEQIHAAFDEADAVVGFNSKSFDTRWVLGELAREGYAPPSPFSEVDLYREARSLWKYPSHRLAYLTKALGVKTKLDAGGFGTWKGVLAGDPKAQRRMGTYCKGDVSSTEEFYYRMLPWLKTLPTATLYVDDLSGLELVCTRPGCESNQLQRRGFSYTRLGKFARYQCQTCTGWLRGRKNHKMVDIRTVG
jgi:DNA polymerase elongation subunit (family B)